MLLDDLTILIDKREKTPLVFPATIEILKPPPSNPMHPGSVRRVFLHTKVVTLKTGDYALQGYETAALVERKGSIEEISQNCLSEDRIRFLKALDRLKEECKAPIILLEGDAKSLRKSTRLCKHPGPALDSLLRILLQYQIPFCTLRSSSMEDRMACGELVARLLIAGALQWPFSPRLLVQTSNPMQGKVSPLPPEPPGSSSSTPIPLLPPATRA